MVVVVVVVVVVPSITLIFLEKWLFSIIYFEKTIRLIFMKFSGFVYHVEDYCCANFRNQQRFLTFKLIELENRDSSKSLYFYIVSGCWKKEKKKEKKASFVWVLALNY